MTKKFYDIHGIISVVVNINQWYMPNNSLDSLEVFRVNLIEEPDITINVNYDVKKPEDCCIVNHKNYIAYNSVYTEGKYKALRYQAAYSWLQDNKVNLDVCLSFANKFIVLQRYAILQNLFIQPLIEIELLKRGYMTIHAAAVSYKNRGYLLVGRGGVYKTTLSMWLVRQKNYSFLGDDKVLLNQSGIIFSYQTLPKIFMFRVKNLKDERISLVQKLRFFFQEVANNHPTVLQQSQSTLAGLIFLSKTERYTDPRRVPKDKAIKKLMTNYRLEKVSSQGLGGYSNSILGNLLLCHEFIYPNSEISALDDKYTSLCKKIIQHDDYCELYAENEFNNKYFDCVLNAIEGVK